MATPKYGVRDDDGNLSDAKLKEIAAHDQVRMFELRMSQGAKPGKGGILPGAKVNAEIAAIRGIPEGEDSISPNRHPEVTDAASLLDMINHIREVTGKPVGFKAVVASYAWLSEMAVEIQRRGIQSAPDFITVDSGDGGTGAAPMPLMDNVGLVVRESLPLVVDIITEHGLRDRIKIIASGKLVTPSEVAWALATGADFINSARGFMFSLGCIQALKCNKNTCPTGITTHNNRLQKGLDSADKSAKAANFCKNLILDVKVISHSCGVGRLRLLKRKHVRIMQLDGTSVAMDERYPYKDVLPEYLPKTAAK
jgi:glutamate synthase domain-containing protein 2